MDPEVQAIMVYVSLIISIGGMIIGVINHKRIISKCNKRSAEMSFDINNTTP